MVYFFSLIIIGLSGLFAQVVILRELLVSFYGNELTIGIILANWIISEALGVFILGKIIDRVKNRIMVFSLFEALFVILLPLSIYFSRSFKFFAGIQPGETLGLTAICLYSFLIILPIGFCHGALFSICSKLFPFPLGKIYGLETLGTLLGGVILTYLSIPFLNSFQACFIVIIFNLLITLCVIRPLINKSLGIALFILFFCFIYFSLSGFPQALHRDALKKQFSGQNILEYRNSPFANIAVSRQEGEFTFFYNGLPVITSPHPDRQFTQDFAHFPLLFSGHPEDILIVSSGVGGLLNEIIKYPLERIDYTEIDPLLIAMIKKYSTALTEKELNDKRVNIISGDGVFFLENTPKDYDLIFIGLTSPSDLTLNRFFTQGFFRLTKKHLKPGGILALRMHGAEAYFSEELRDLNALVLNALSSVYPYVRVIPGGYNIFLASSVQEAVGSEAAEISGRKIKRNIEAEIFTPAYVEYRLSPKRLEWFRQQMEGATKKINEDFVPLAVFQTLILWNKQFSRGLFFLLKVSYNLRLVHFLIPLALISAVLFILLRRKRGSYGAVSYSIITTGFFGMLTSLILIFSFQVSFGYLYRWIGLLVSLFMAGAASGSLLVSRKLALIKRPLSLLLKFEALIILFIFSLSIIIMRMPVSRALAAIIFVLLFILSGMLLGFEFPLAAEIFLSGKRRVGETAGTLYACDLLGGWIAGILGSVLLLPVLGVFNCCLLLLFLKLSSLALLTTKAN